MPTHNSDMVPAPFRRPTDTLRPSKYGGNENPLLLFGHKSAAFHVDELYLKTTRVIASMDELHKVRTHHAALADRPILTLSRHQEAAGNGKHQITINLQPDPIRDAGYAAERRAGRRMATLPEALLNPEEARTTALVDSLTRELAQIREDLPPGAPRDHGEEGRICALCAELFAAKVYQSALRMLQFRTLGRLDALELPGIAEGRYLNGKALRRVLEEVAEKSMPDFWSDEEDDDEEEEEEEEGGGSEGDDDDDAADADDEDADDEGAQADDSERPAKRRQIIYTR